MQVKEATDYHMDGMRFAIKLIDKGLKMGLSYEKSVELVRNLAYNAEVVK